jgi:uncharacterized protein (TIGR02246 family)
MGAKNVRDVIDEFVKAINKHDIEAIYNLMAENHLFIDSMGREVSGRDEMKKSWIAFFKIVPDYNINISEVFSSDNRLVLLGNASGTYSTDGNLKIENRWKTHAAWRAVVEDNKIAEWKVFGDNEAIRRVIRRER